MQSLDLENVVYGNENATNFHALLFRLLLKADNHNLELLRKGFPNAVSMVERYKKSGLIWNLPYD